MNYKEYVKLINNCNCKLKKENYKEIIDELSELENKYKPINPLIYSIKAKALRMGDIEKNIGIISGILGNKIWALYDYMGVREICDEYLNMSHYYKDDLDIRRMKYCINKCKGAEQVSEEDKEEINYEENEIVNAIKYFFESNANEESVRCLTNSFYILHNFVSYVVLDKVYQKKFNAQSLVRNWPLNSPNLGYLIEKLDSNSIDPFIILTDDAALDRQNFERNQLTCEALATALAFLGKKVYLIDEPVQVEVDEPVDMIDTLQISVENAENYEEFTLFHPVEIICNGKSLGDNREYLIEYINETFSGRKLSMVLCSGTLIDELSKRKMMMKKLERLTQFQADYYEPNIQFGWYGNYLAYISDVYGFDVEKAIDAPAECDFSIVIPARNSVASLEYTLKTCLDIEYDGTYEIVISDNSTDGTGAVHDLVNRLNDDRIKYYRTPRDLHLPKSFEYAFLKARGEFIFSIGSDDGVLPYALRVLRKVLDDNPKDEIIQWDRGFYAWPGFNKGQQNQFVVPRKYDSEDNLDIVRTPGIDNIAQVLNDPKNMYGMPMLYINSGFRRRYFRTLLNKTGRLWDGICQDLYMGVINSAINYDILVVKYPLTIAGMTNASEGKVANSAKKTVEEINKDLDKTLKSNNVGGFSMSAIERLMPELRSDVSSLYNSLLRAVARGVLPMQYVTDLYDFKKMYINCIELMDKSDVLYDRNTHYMRYVATKHGEEFLKWFDDKIMPFMQTLEIKEDNSNNQGEIVAASVKPPKRTYTIGRGKFGDLTLDGSEYGLKNIHDAVKLFNKIVKGESYGKVL